MRTHTPAPVVSRSTLVGIRAKRTPRTNERLQFVVVDDAWTWRHVVGWGVVVALVAVAANLLYVGLGW